MHPVTVGDSQEVDPVAIQSVTQHLPVVVHTVLRTGRHRGIHYIILTHSAGTFIQSDSRTVVCVFVCVHVYVCVYIYVCVCTCGGSVLQCWCISRPAVVVTPGSPYRRKGSRRRNRWLLLAPPTAGG